MTRENEQRAERFVKELATSIFRQQDTPIHCAWGRERGKLNLEIDLGDWEAGVMIGSGGAMKYAVQQLIAASAGLGLDELNVHYRSRRTRPVPETIEKDPDPTLIEPTIAAIADLMEANSHAVEKSDTMVCARIWFDEPNYKGWAHQISRIVRAIGKANGFGATVLLDQVEG